MVKKSKEINLKFLVGEKKEKLKDFLLNHKVLNSVKNHASIIA